MRIGLLSDTHGILNPAFKAIDAMGDIDLLIHCGDHYRDASKIAAWVNVPVHAVVGNCDSRMDGPDEKLLDLEGILIYITHGHRYNVKNSLMKLYYRALELKASVAVFGHTHVAGYGYTHAPGCPNSEGLLMINPGSVSDPRGGDRLSYGVLEIEGGVVRPGIHYL
ncbi:MAG: metallophosphoesterase family protein [Bacillota bacterium]